MLCRYLLVVILGLLMTVGCWSKESSPPPKKKNPTSTPLIDDKSPNLWKGKKASLPSEPGVKAFFANSPSVLFVYATQEGALAEVVRETAREVADKLAERYNGKITVMADTELTRSRGEKSHLILWGPTGAHRQLIILKDLLAVKLSRTYSFSMGKDKYSDLRQAVVFVSGHPLNQGKNLLVITGNSFAAVSGIEEYPKSHDYGLYSGGRLAEKGTWGR